jgi:hypothetical protein
MSYEQITRRNLRSQVSKEAGDNYGDGTATGGDTTSLIDTAGLHALNVDDYKGVWAYIHKGTAIGRESWCSTSTAVTGDLTLVTGTAISTDSEYELHRRWRFLDWNNSIARAMRTDRLKQLLPMLDRTILVTTSGTREYTIPAGTRSLHKVGYLTDNDITNEETPVPLGGWEINTGSTGAIERVIRFTGDEIPPESASLVLHGMKFPEIPIEDNQIIQVNIELLTLHMLWQYARRFKSRLDAREARDEYAAFSAEASVSVPENSRIVEQV